MHNEKAASKNIKTDCDSAVERCLQQIAHNDREALAELYQLTHAAVYSFAFSILRNAHDAEDVLQECCITVYHAAGSYRPMHKPMAWILTITKNLCRQKLRRQQQAMLTDWEQWADEPETNENVSVEEKLLLSQCLRQLSAEELQIVVLHAVSGFKHREIAELLELPLATVLSKYHRALKKLKKYFSGESEI